MGNLVCGAANKILFAGQLHDAQGRLSRVSEARARLGMQMCDIARLRNLKRQDTISDFQKGMGWKICNEGAKAIAGGNQQQGLQVYGPQLPMLDNTGKIIQQGSETPYLTSLDNVPPWYQGNDIDSKMKEASKEAQTAEEKKWREYFMQEKKEEAFFDAIKYALEKQDKNLELEQKTLETAVKLLEGLQKAHEQLCDSAIKDAAPKFGGGGGYG